jgi:hypothetical protein
MLETVLFTHAGTALLVIKILLTFLTLPLGH